MPTLLRNVLAFIAGVAIGCVVNMALVMLSPSLIPPPDGVNVNDPESLSRSMHLFAPRHFVMPFLAHALGTLAGAVAAYLIAEHKLPMALVIGVVFLCGGVAASLMVPAPTWFIALDLLAAYLPMAWLGTKIGARLAHGPAHTPTAAGARS